MESIEADAAAAARDDAPSGATATEIKGRITKWIESRPSATKARADLREAERRKAKLERWFRTLEKRMSAAQSAQNGHDQIARQGGRG